MMTITLTWLYLNCIYELFGTVKSKQMLKSYQLRGLKMKGGCWLNSSGYVSPWKILQMILICQDLALFQFFMMYIRELQLGNKLGKAPILLAFLNQRFKINSNA